ncbi:uncharacterized protein PV06_11819 [Exophiala oligosperma]|uniref:Uncharacterized protein n=1 Tax=Exophiala oligosperma TaxID=215243 RepID=A0A0D2BEC4_9EURO|nr:uncharacterized protein PV06_11819 [Exophiala oligosperma]KIW35857.1 hypothetical protein PV06_11819 [Exophiala oligosperma]
MNWVTLNLLGDEMAFTVAYPSEETIKSVPSKPSWLQLLTQYKGSFRQDDTTLANEMQRVIRKEIKHTTRSVSVIEVWRILSAEVSHREPSLPFNIMPIIVNGMRFNTETHAQSKPTTLLTE